MSRTPQRGLHRLAVTTLCVAVVTVTAGALVTSRHAGMAFRDWPTSDGQGMLSYPWWQDFARNWDKFLEHGHRLAGVLIGLWSIALAVVVGWWEPRRWVRACALCALLGVICQGVLGGFRVWFDARGLALLHGLSAACLLSLMGVTCCALSAAWLQPEIGRGDAGRLAAMKPLAVVVAGLILMQYLLGGLLRHHGSALHEHLGLGVVVCLAALAQAIFVTGSRIAWVVRSSWVLAGIVLVQVALGGLAWMTKFGLASAGYVAVADSIQQTAFRTTHMVVGVLVMVSAVVHAARVLRLSAVHDESRSRVDTMQRAASAGLLPGGAR
jgi:cytochrome c oxidase assembly protein subunit 15